MNLVWSLLILLRLWMSYDYYYVFTLLKNYIIKDINYFNIILFLINFHMSMILIY